MRKKLSIFGMFLAGSLLLSACGNPNTQPAPVNNTNNQSQTENQDEQQIDDQSDSDSQEQDSDQSDSEQTDESQDSNDAATQPPGLPEDNDATLQSLIQEKEDATQMIQSEFPDTHMVLSVLKFRNSFSDTEGLATNYYIFEKPAGSDQRFYYVADMPRDGTPSRVFLLLQKDFDFGQSLLPVPHENWQVTYVGAIQEAESLGGAQFRSRNENWEVTAILGKPAGEEQSLSWSVNYRALDGSGTEFIVSVNAQNGDAQVVEEPPITQDNIS